MKFLKIYADFLFAFAVIWVVIAGAISGMIYIVATFSIFPGFIIMLGWFFFVAATVAALVEYSEKNT